MSAFKKLIKKYGEPDGTHSIIHPSTTKRTYLFYDSVHLVKNIRNNLLNNRSFAFPPFSFEEFHDPINVQAGWIDWSLLHKIREKDELLPANLRKAPKITEKTLHPGNNKQSVPLALNVFHRTTSTAITDYFPNEKDASSFLNLIYIWWSISNSKHEHNPSWRLADAAKANDMKPSFLRKMADYIEEWEMLSETVQSWVGSDRKLGLTANTANALKVTLCCTANLIEELLAEGYQYVLTARFQTDPLERRFSRYRQMSGGAFLLD